MAQRVQSSCTSRPTSRALPIWRRPIGCRSVSATNPRLVRSPCAPDDPRMTDAIGPPEPEAGGILTIDLAAIVANWRALGARAAPAECAGVVKADGYGCG